MMSKSDNLNLINFIANGLYLESSQGVGVLWLCLDYRVRAQYRRDAQILFEKWVLNETVAREKRDKNIPTYEEVE